MYTIMADGTTDKNRKEIQGLVCRYLSSKGDIVEHCVNIKGVDDRSAGVWRGVGMHITMTYVWKRFSQAKRNLEKCRNTCRWNSIAIV